jgi:hypothetical protein
VCSSSGVILESRGQQLCNPVVELLGDSWVCMNR